MGTEMVPVGELGGDPKSPVSPVLGMEMVRGLMLPEPEPLLAELFSRGGDTSEEGGENS